MNRVVLALCVYTSHCVLAYQHFQEKIPNGDQVPHPASPSLLWQGVGHLSADGGGTRNVFGLDFAENNFQWDTILCQKDSDGDGRTNGQELGDPGCEWSPGTTPMTNTALSHPGICEPVDSEMCKTVNLDILLNSGQPFDCPPTKEPDVKSSIYRFPVFDIPAEETNWYCKYFPLDVPEGSSEHVIAYEPIIVNMEALHHINAYACREPQAKALVGRLTPESCGGHYACTENIAVWNHGMNGVCYPKQFGMAIGKGGYSGIWMEIHWNNPLKTSGLTDSSGIKLYHTPVKREFDASYAIWGALTLELPPGKVNILQTGGCPSTCTKRLTKETLYIAHIMPHMHHKGRAMTVTINGKRILEESNFQYGSPKIYSFDPPLPVHRGDHVGVNCTFTTTETTERTYSGHATSDEMCYAESLVYPIDSSVPLLCIEADGWGFCGQGAVGDFGPDCNYRYFMGEHDWTMLTGVLAPYCDPAGVECWEWCPDAIQRVKKKAPCFAGARARAVRGFVNMHPEARNFLNYLLGCEEVVYNTEMMDEEDYDKFDLLISNDTMMLQEKDMLMVIKDAN